MTPQLRTGQRIKEVLAAAGNSIVGGKTVDGASPQLSISLAPQSLGLSVVSELDMKSFINVERHTACIWNTSCHSYKEQGKQRNAVLNEICTKLFNVLMMVPHTNVFPQVL